MSTRSDEDQGDRAGQFWMAAGWAAILFPAIYMSTIGWDSGEHANVPIIIGLLASGWQGAVWASIWFVQRRMDAPNPRMTFGMGVPLSLIASLSLLAATQDIATPYTRLAWAGLAYLVIAALAIWATSRHTITRFTAERN